MAQGIERTLTAWLALQLGADAFEIGLSFAARMLPSLLLGLAAGTIADRTDRSRQLGAVALAAAISYVKLRMAGDSYYRSGLVCNYAVLYSGLYYGL